MVKIKEKPINVSNTTLSSYKRNGHRKFDAKQAIRHNFGKTHCMICDKVFTKYHHLARLCSEECKRENHRVGQRKRYKEKRKDPEWVKKEAAKNRKYLEENLEKIAAYQRKWREENPEKMKAYDRKFYEENREKRKAYQRKHYAENSEKIKAKRRNKYRAKKKQEEE